MSEITRTPEEYFSIKGRAIEDLKPKQELFERLKEGRDYQLEEVNNSIQSPRDVREFFLFVNPDADPEKAETRTVKAPHWRTITTPDVHTVLNFDPDGNSGAATDHFYAVNTKGVGFLKPTLQDGHQLNQYRTWTPALPDGQTDTSQQRYKILGLAPCDEFYCGPPDNLLKSTTMLAHEGMRTEVFWGVARLNRLWYQGKSETIETLQAKDVLPADKDFQPYMGVRVLKSNTRIEEMRDDERHQEIFTEAFEVFNKETTDKKLTFPQLNIEQEKDQEIFVKEFCKRIGSNLGVLLNFGLMHNFLHKGNITIAAEFADMGTAVHYTDNGPADTESKKHRGLRYGHIKDIRDIAYTCREFFKSAKRFGLETGTRETLLDALMDGYHQTKKDEALTYNDIDPASADQWVRDIFDTVLVKKENLPSLTNNPITTWPMMQKN